MVFPSDILNNSTDPSVVYLRNKYIFFVLFFFLTYRLFLAYTSSQSGGFLELWPTC